MVENKIIFKPLSGSKTLLTLWNIKQSIESIMKDERLDTKFSPDVSSSLAMSHHNLNVFFSELYSKKKK